MSIYQASLVYGIRELNAGMVLDWDFVHKSGMDIFFEKSEPFYAQGPFYGIKTEMNPLTGYVKRGKPMKDAVDEFHAKLCKYCASHGMAAPPAPEFACVLFGDLNYNLQVYSLEEIEYEGVKSTVCIEVGHANTSADELDRFVRAKISGLCAGMDAEDFTIKKKEGVEYSDTFVKLFREDKMEDELSLESMSLDNGNCFLRYKLIFRHDERKDAWRHIQKIILLKTVSEEHDDDSLKLGDSYVYFHVVGSRARIGNVWLSEASIMD